MCLIHYDDLILNLQQHLHTQEGVVIDTVKTAVKSNYSIIIIKLQIIRTLTHFRYMYMQLYLKGLVLCEGIVKYLLRTTQLKDTTSNIRGGSNAIGSPDL